MDIVCWSRDRRVLGRAEAAELDGELGSSPILFRFATREMEVAPHGGPFSLKIVMAGAEHYRFDRRAVRLEAGQAMLVNSQARYSSAIRNAPTEALSIFLPPDALAAALWAARPDETLLDDPQAPPAEPEVLHSPWTLTPGHVASLRRLDELLTARRFDEATDAAYAFSGAVLRHWLQRPEPPALAGLARRTTREELFARLERARAYVEDNAGHGCTLDRLARIACMSKHHFLRRFAEVYGATPAAYARRRRLQTAQALLCAGAARTTAAEAAGYRRPRSMDRALRRG